MENGDTQEIKLKQLTVFKSPPVSSYVRLRVYIGQYIFNEKRVYPIIVRMRVIGTTARYWSSIYIILNLRLLVYLAPVTRHTSYMPRGVLPLLSSRLSYRAHYKLQSDMLQRYDSRFLFHH